MHDADAQEAGDVIREGSKAMPRLHAGESEVGERLEGLVDRRMERRGFSWSSLRGQG